MGQEVKDVKQLEIRDTPPRERTTIRAKHGPTMRIESQDIDGGPGVRIVFFGFRNSYVILDPRQARELIRAIEARLG